MSTNSIISIQELLKGRGRNKEFDQADPKRIKFFNHSGVVGNSIISNDYDGCPIYKLYRENYAKFLEWQSEQYPKTMKNTDFIVVFLSEENCESRYIGVFKNCGELHPTPNGGIFYDLKEISGFEILKERVVIHYGIGRQRFDQGWHNIKEVIRIEQKTNDSEVPVFKRYEDVVLSYKQLNTVVKDKEWQSKLNCLNCVYVILDKKNGKQYVGVTYKDVNTSKKNGILNRWTEYADSGHGNNKKIVELIKKEGIAYAEKNFQWSILETLPLNVTQKVAIDRETLYKEKLGTREHGYNEN